MGTFRFLSVVNAFWIGSTTDLRVAYYYIVPVVCGNGARQTRIGDYRYTNDRG